MPTRRVTPPPPPRTRTFEINAVASGHKRVAKQIEVALVADGFELVPMPSNAWGLSSYTDPITAEGVGKPNAGHTPGTSHPETLRFVVVDGDHDPGCTRLSPNEWREAYPAWKPKVKKVPLTDFDGKPLKGADGKQIVVEFEESIDEDDERLFLPCEHIGSTEERVHECRHVGASYVGDDRIGFVGAKLTLPEKPDAMTKVANRVKAVVEPLGWQLRLHWETQPVPTPLTLTQRLEASGIDVDELRELMQGS